MTNNCNINKKTVLWTIDKDLLKKIKDNISNGKHEISGDIIFKDTKNCNNGLCNKKSIKDNKIFTGKGSSVGTPHGIVNFHTHPKHIYKKFKTKYGWPSGEDMNQINKFFRKSTLLHIVFTVEGAYMIKVNKKLNLKQGKMVEDILINTHEYRMLNQAAQKKNFEKKFNIKGKTTLQMWLKLINSLTLKKLYDYYNSFNKTKLKIPKKDLRYKNAKIFNVRLVKLGPVFKFKINHINQRCHYTLYGRNLL